jgi:ketosteroid isomerase-like protein
MPGTKNFFATPQDAETAFYEALEHADLEAMMALWSEDDEIVCIHPGGPRLAGYATIREAWRRIFEGGAKLRVQITPLSAVVNPFTAIHSLIEHVSVVGQNQQTTPIATTNVYVRGPTGWRMVVHHGSPSPPETFAEAPKILH